jgi:sugar/nucleoside kinase (ribokinase family)
LGIPYEMPATPPPFIKDRTGAGDVAAAGFLAGRLRNLDITECLRLSSEAASRSLMGYGRSSYPDKDFLDARFRERTEHARDESAS